MAESTIMKTLNGRKVYDEDARKELENIKNAAPGLVFDTVADMEAYIADSADTLKVGQDLFIREADVPDYWWDGTKAIVVETDLSGVRKDLDQLSEEIADLGGTLIEPAEDDIPKVFFTGDTSGMTKENEKILRFSYKSESTDFDGYVKMKWQGSSSISFPKKNFTIKMFSDEACETKLKKTFRDWNHEGNKYVLKANYIDHTHARNIITANLWSEIVASRSDYDTLPEELRNSPRNGAVDGFPIKLYLNGKYEGIYTWNIGKDDWMFGMDENNENHAVLCAKKNNNGDVSTTDTAILACEFRANANIDENDWGLEVPDTLHDNIKTSFNALIDCVKDTDDTTFKATIGNYLDVTSAFDYYILMYFSAAVDNLANNLIMITYDGIKWYCSAYDLDNIWGSRGTNTFVSADFQCPEGYQDTNSLLWQRIEQCFGAELYTRYLELRKNVLAFPNVIDKFERFCDLIGTELYAEDVEIYSGIPYPTQNNLKQIREYFQPRADYVDACMTEIGTPTETIPCTGITLSANTLTFTETGSQTITATVTPDNTTDTITWTSDNVSVATVSGGVVQAIGNGNATITATCGAYSAACSVEVSGIAVDTSILYALANPVIIASAADGIDTGVSLWESDIDFTIAVKATRTASADETTLFSCNKEGVPYNGIGVAWNYPKNVIPVSIYGTNGGTPATVNLDYPIDYVGEVLLVIMHTASSGDYTVKHLYDGSVRTTTISEAFVAHTNHLGVGVANIWSTPVRPWTGSIEDFRILNRVMTDDEITAYFSV